MAKRFLRMQPSLPCSLVMCDQRSLGTAGVAVRPPPSRDARSRALLIGRQNYKAFIDMTATSSGTASMQHRSAGRSRTNTNTPAMVRSIRCAGDVSFPSRSQSDQRGCTHYLHVPRGMPENARSITTMIRKPKPFKTISLTKIRDNNNEKVLSCRVNCRF